MTRSNKKCCRPCVQLLHFTLLLTVAACNSRVHAARLLLQSAAPAAMKDGSSTFGAAPADSADCKAVCSSALGMDAVDGGVNGQQACAVYREPTWMPQISSTNDFRGHADYGVKASPTTDAGCNIYSSTGQKFTSVPFVPWSTGSPDLPSFWCLCQRDVTAAHWTTQGKCSQGSTSVCRLVKRNHQLGGVVTGQRGTGCESANIAEYDPARFQELCTEEPAAEEAAQTAQIAAPATPSPEVDHIAATAEEQEPSPTPARTSAKENVRAAESVQQPQQLFSPMPGFQHFRPSLPWTTKRTHRNW